MSIKDNIETSSVLSKPVLGDSAIAFYRDYGKVVEYIGVLSLEEMEISQNNPLLLDKEQVIRVNKVLKELNEDANAKARNSDIQK